MPINVDAHRLFFLVGLSVLLAVSACDKESTDSPSAPEASKKLQKEAKELIETAKADDCPTFAKELQEACSSVVDKRMSFDCKKHLITFEIAQQQAGGKLFDTGADNAKVASALCKKGIKGLRKDVAKATAAGSEPVAWAASCKDYIATIRKDCLTQIEKGTQAEHCGRTIGMLNMAIDQKNDGAMSCGMGAMYFKK